MLQIILLIFIAVILVFVGFWFASAIIAGFSGAPVVYADRRIILKALKLAELKPNDTFLDLGCGDGRSLLIAHQKFSARAIGVEKSLFCFVESKIRTRKFDNILVHYRDLKNSQNLISKADVIYLYLLPKIMVDIEKMIFDNSKKGARIISIAFKFRNHSPVKTTKINNPNYKITIRCYQK